MKKIILSKALFFYCVFMLVLTAISGYVVHKVNAGTLTPAKVTISDSRASGVGVSYQYNFTTTVSTGIKRIDIQFCTTASGTCTAATGISTTAVQLTSNNLSGSSITTTAPAQNQIQVNVGSTATQSPTAVSLVFGNITNPSTANTTYFSRITTYSDTGSTTIDDASVAFAILDTTSIAVSAAVDSTFSFTVAGVGTTSTVNGAGTNITTTATTIPFGTLTSSATKIAAHDLTVVSNALNGYQITVKSLISPPLNDGSNNIDPFTGTNTAPAAWSSPNGSSASVNTGWFGYTTNDSALGSGTADRFTDSGPKWAGVTATASEIAYNAGAVSTETTRVGWEIEVNNLQPSGDYTGTVILVATPTY